MKLYRAFLMAIVGAITLAFTSACDTDKRDLYIDRVPGEDVDVEVSIDWSVAGSTPSEYTMILYPTDGSRSEVMVVDGSESKVTIESGTYSMVVFNGTLKSYPDIEFKDITKYETIKVNMKSGVQSLDNTLLYSACQESVLIAPGVPALTLKPTKIFSLIYATTYVSSINKLKTTGNKVTISGFAKGIYLHNGKVTNESKNISFDLPTFDYNEGSSTDGYLKGQAKCFGVAESRDDANTVKNIASLSLKGVDGKNITQHQDVTESIVMVDAGSRIMSVDIVDIEL